MHKHFTVSTKKSVVRIDNKKIQAMKLKAEKKVNVKQRIP